jgi:anti-sigma B factor antagonist
MASVFEANLHVGDGYAVVSLVGELDVGTAPILRSAFERVTDAGLELVVVDAEQLGFIDSSGLGCFIGAHKALTHHGGLLVIANLPSKLLKPLRVTGLSKAIPTQVSDEPTHPWAAPTSPAHILTALGFTSAVPMARPEVRDVWTTQ